MPKKDAKTKARDSDSKSGTKQDQDTVYAGGNPGFDERKPSSQDKSARTVHAGVNPDFDERKA